MKFASRISSIAATPGSSAGRAPPTRGRCGPTRSPASAGRMDPFAPASRKRVTGCWASQSISSRDRWRSSRRWPGRAGRGRARSARTGTGPAWAGSARVQVRWPGHGPTPAKSATSELTLTGSRTWGACPAPSSWTSRPPSPAARAAAQGRVVLLVVGAVDHQHRAVDPLAERPGLGRVDDLRLPAAEPGHDRLHVGVPGPADTVLDLLGGVGLGEAGGEEELQVAGPVAKPVPTRLLGPALVSAGGSASKG